MKHRLTLFAGKLALSINVDGDTAPGVAEGDAYKDTPAQRAMASVANPPEWELYYLQTDLGEFQNRADDSAHFETLTRMQCLLLDWRKETHDPFLDPAAMAKRHSEVNVSSDNSIPAKLNKKK
jgi:hypothetical protein